MNNLMINKMSIIQFKMKNKVNNLNLTQIKSYMASQCQIVEAINMWYKIKYRIQK